ncbi:hypothetical protein EON79_17365, partial [bacterium]
MILARVLSIGLAATMAVAAQAHFVWATLTPDRTTLKLMFAEFPGDSVLPAFAGKSATTKAFIGPNQPLELKLETDDRLLSAKLPSPRSVVGADLVYGVTDRGEAGPYLLSYHAKAAADIASSAQSVGAPVEVFLSSATGGTVILVRSRGKAAPGAEIVVHPETGEEFKATADAQGQVTVPAATPVAGVRAMVPEAAKGTHEGKKYDLVRHYATLVVGTGRSTIPADPEAYKMLENAAAKRQNFPADLKGLSGKFVMEKDGEQVQADFK